jgi:hypothetical protein
MTLYQFFRYLQYQSTVGVVINGSTWLFAVVEAVHLIGLGFIGASVIVLNLRLMGFGLTAQPTRVIAAYLRPWLIGSLLLMTATGTLLACAVATKLYDSFPFWVKISCFTGATAFTFIVQQRVAMKDEGQISVAWRRAVAVWSLLLWAGVAWGGRWIAFA